MCYFAFILSLLALLFDVTSIGLFHCKKCGPKVFSIRVGVVLGLIGIFCKVVVSDGLFSSYSLVGIVGKKFD